MWCAGSLRIGHCAVGAYAALIFITPAQAASSALDGHENGHPASACVCALGIMQCFLLAQDLSSCMTWSIPQSCACEPYRNQASVHVSSRPFRRILTTGCKWLTLILLPGMMSFHISKHTVDHPERFTGLHVHLQLQSTGIGSCPGKQAHIRYKTMMWIMVVQSRHTFGHAGRQAIHQRPARHHPRLCSQEPAPVERSSTTEPRSWLLHRQ